MHFAGPLTADEDARMSSTTYTETSSAGSAVADGCAAALGVLLTLPVTAPAALAVGLAAGARRAVEAWEEARRERASARHAEVAALGRLREQADSARDAARALAWLVLAEDPGPAFQQFQERVARERASRVRAGAAVLHRSQEQARFLALIETSVRGLTDGTEVRRVEGALAQALTLADEAVRLQQLSLLADSAERGLRMQEREAPLRQRREKLAREVAICLQAVASQNDRADLRDRAERLFQEAVRVLDPRRTALSDQVSALEALLPRADELVAECVRPFQEAILEAQVMEVLAQLGYTVERAEGGSAIVSLDHDTAVEVEVKGSVLKTELVATGASAAAETEAREAAACDLHERIVKGLERRDVRTRCRTESRPGRTLRKVAVTRRAAPRPATRGAAPLRRGDA